MKQITNQRNINRLLQTMSEDAQQAVSGGAIYSHQVAPLAEPEYKYVPIRGPIRR